MKKVRKTLALTLAIFVIFTLISIPDFAATAGYQNNAMNMGGSLSGTSKEGRASTWSSTSRSISVKNLIGTEAAGNKITAMGYSAFSKSVTISIRGTKFKHVQSTHSGDGLLSKTLTVRP